MHVGWCAARPEGPDRSEGGEGCRVREPDRKESSERGAGARWFVVFVAWQSAFLVFVAQRQDSISFYSTMPFSGPLVSE